MRYLYYLLAAGVLLGLGIFIVRTLVATWRGVDVTYGARMKREPGPTLWHVLVVPMMLGFYSFCLGGILVSVPAPGDERVILDLLPSPIPGVLLLAPFFFLALMAFMAIFRRPRFLIPPMARRVSGQRGGE